VVDEQGEPADPLGSGQVGLPFEPGDEAWAMVPRLVRSGEAEPLVEAFKRAQVLTARVREQFDRAGLGDIDALTVAPGLDERGRPCVWVLLARRGQAVWMVLVPAVTPVGVRVRWHSRAA
jgi:hypothetical protein